MSKVFNISKNKDLRQKLRKNMTEPEKRLWRLIKNKQLGVKFRRQHGIGNYIVDFYCPEKRLVIEVDGDSHFSDESLAYDLVRDSFMEALDIEVLRFSNLQVMSNIEGVLSVISLKLDNPL